MPAPKPTPPSKPLTWRSPCPFPHKRRFVDGDAANTELAHIHERNNTDRPKMEKRAYECVGHWHLTSDEVPKKPYYTRPKRESTTA